MEDFSSQAQVLSGILENVKIKNTTAEVFFRRDDSERIAATGVVAAALGLSGAAAGMAAMSMDEAKEPVCQVSFDLGDKHVEGMLWDWPFKEGDEVQVVVERVCQANCVTRFFIAHSSARVLRRTSPGSFAEPVSSDGWTASSSMPRARPKTTI
ncbi:putative type VI secretion system effector [Xanthomonas oryzae]|uniref:putative type VI secretion system effector n=1 Tax=Xanthomonas oryzae TaxID=347 RepID=UPI003AAEE390